jgi:hypothetical protein
VCKQISGLDILVVAEGQLDVCALNVPFQIDLVFRDKGAERTAVFGLWMHLSIVMFDLVFCLGREGAKAENIQNTLYYSKQNNELPVDGQNDIQSGTCMYGVVHMTGGN